MTSATPFRPGDQVVAYLRDSGGQDQDLSVEQQESVIRTWCLDHRLVLTQIFRDLRAPGSNVVGRRQFREMVHHFQAKPAEAGVILWKYSRFARDIDDAQFYKALLRRSGYIIHSLQDAVPNGIDGRFFEAAIDWMNNKFLEELSADVRRGIRHLVEQYGCLPGTPPVGFRRVPVIIGKRRTGADHIAHRWEPDPAMTDRQKEIDALPAGETGDLQLMEQETRRQLGEVRRKIKNLVRLIADQGESARSLLGELTDLERQETEIETRHHQLIEKLDQVNRPIDLQQVQIDAAALRQAIQTAPDMETLRAIVKSQIDRVTARRVGDTVQAIITYYHPPLNAEPPGEAGGSYAYGHVPPRRHLQKHKFTLTLSVKIPRKTNVIK